MKEAVTKVIDMLTQEDFHDAFQKLLERYNKWIAAGGDYFAGDKSFMCVLSIKVPIRKKSGNLFNDPRITNNLIKHQSFVYTQLNDQTFLFLTIQFNTSHLFSHSLNVKQSYLTHG